jgi:hypothetical protein
MSRAETSLPSPTSQTDTDVDGDACEDRGPDPGVEPQLAEVDRSSVFCEIIKWSAAQQADAADHPSAGR